MMAKKLMYVANLYNRTLAPIVCRTIDRETDKFVWFNGRRVATRSMTDNYFDTFAEARKALLNEGEKRLARAEAAVISAKAFIRAAKMQQVPEMVDD